VSFPVDFFFPSALGEKKQKKKKKRKKEKKKKQRKKKNGRRGARSSELPLHRSGGVVGYVHSRNSHGV
jgi:hypothetical protein